LLFWFQQWFNKFKESVILLFTQATGRQTVTSSAKDATHCNVELQVCVLGDDQISSDGKLGDSISVYNTVTHSLKVASL